ncbi:MAG: ATP-grasp domain-containing protein, partial [Acholeplasma sp.]|nr:ATP-grasp domain-containing protein [Acholeplasma sp.]
MKTKILLTSAGGLTGVFLTKHLSKYKDIEIYCIDMTKNNPLQKWTHNVYLCPSTSSTEYSNYIKQFVKEHSIDIIIPVTSYDVEFFSKKSNQNLIKEVKMLIIDEQINLILSNKESCYLYLRSLGIKTPFIYNNGNIDFPCFIKPFIGSGSKNAIKVDSIEDYNYWNRKLGNSLVTEYLEGSEYTVDCLFDLDYKCIGYNTRERVKTTSGGATITQNVEIDGVNSIIAKLESTKKIIGPVNFQFKLIDKNLVVFDFNTRLASGGLPLTVYTDLDIPRKIIDILLGQKPKKFIRETKRLG